MEKLKCERCGHEWIPRIDKKPKACPGCKNYRWNKPKGITGITNAKADNDFRLTRNMFK